MVRFEANTPNPTPKGAPFYIASRYRKLKKTTCPVLGVNQVHLSVRADCGSASSGRTWSNTPRRRASRMQTARGQHQLRALERSQYAQIQLPTLRDWHNPQNESHVAPQSHLRNFSGCSVWRVPTLFAGNFLSDMRGCRGLKRRCGFANTRSHQTTIEEYRERRRAFHREFYVPRVAALYGEYSEEKNAAHTSSYPNSPRLNASA